MYGRKYLAPCTQVLKLLEIGHLRMVFYVSLATERQGIFVE